MAEYEKSGPGDKDEFVTCAPKICVVDTEGELVLVLNDLFPEQRTGFRESGKSKGC